MTSIQAPKATKDFNDLNLPRILCLHGGGTNGAIFKLQCRVLKAQLDGKFRLCFADAPFTCEAGPGILPIYGAQAPFRRWLRWESHHDQADSETIIKAIDNCITSAMEKDDEFGGDGEWVGILGFSQGAKVAGSLLLRQQIRSQNGILKGNTTFRFGILMNGRAPLVSLDTRLMTSPRLSSASEITTHDYDHLLDEPEFGWEARIRLPTIHVHGLRDPGLQLHRQLLEHYCGRESAHLVQWDGEHRIPLKRSDIAPLIDEISKVAAETKAL